MNGKKATLKDIAEKLGVSIQTVSLAVNRSGRISAALRERILATAREMKYVPNPAARALAGGRARRLGVALPLTRNSLFPRLFAAMERAAYERGFTLLAADTEGGADVEKAAIARLRECDPDGLFLLPDAANADLYRELLLEELPLVQLLRRLPDLPVPVVGVADFEAAKQATEQLLANQPSGIAMLTHGDTLSTSVQRSAGFQAALEESECDALECEVSFDLAEIESDTIELLNDNPDIGAIFCADDLAALGALRAAAKCKRAVPEDLEVIGFGALDFSERQISGDFTSIAIDAEALGGAAVGLMLDVLDGKSVSDQEIPATLVRRASTRPVL